MASHTPRRVGGASPASGGRALRALLVAAAAMGSVLLVIALSMSRLEEGSAASPPVPPRPDNHRVTTVARERRDVSLRPVYRYSVVRGGVYGAREAMEAMAADPVVARHYADVHAAAARVTRVAAPRAAYMSYRIGNRVFWTKTPVALAEGEAVLTDGRTEIRARCGNRISETPMTPTLEAEPALREFDRVLAPAPQSTMFDPAALLAILPLVPAGATPPPGVNPFAIGGIGSGPFGYEPAVPGYPLVPGGVLPAPATPGGPILPPATRDPLDPVLPPGDPGTSGGPPPAVPEPQILLLVSAGLLSYSVWRGRLR